jgi:hypothetical protein
MGRSPLLVATILLAVNVGCGGGGSEPAEVVITQANASTFSEDAKLLAAREADGAWISAEDAASFDADLQRIRGQYPIVNTIHARRTYSLTDLMVGIKLTTPWRDGWKSQTLATGDSGVDGVLNGFHAASVTPMQQLDDHQLFLLRFAQPMHVPACVDPVKSSNVCFVYAGDTGRQGDGDDITFERVGDVKKYTFSHGWGDCSSGCISRHFWQVSLMPEGSMTMVESGDDLSGDPRFPPP